MQKHGTLFLEQTKNVVCGGLCHIQGAVALAPASSHSYLIHCVISAHMSTFPKTIAAN